MVPRDGSMTKFGCRFPQRDTPQGRQTTMAIGPSANDPAGGASFTVTAAGATTTYTAWESDVPACSYSLSPTSATFTSAGGSSLRV